MSRTRAGERGDMAAMDVFRVCAGGGGDGLAAGGGLAALMVLGLAGSLLHCGPMCGPLVLGQSVHRLSCLSCARMSQGTRLQAGLLLPYHAGRITTYALLGALAGGTGGAAFAITRTLQVAGLLAVALCLLALALGKGRLRPPAPGRFAARLAPGGYMFGLVLGLMPCGLLYGALLAALVTGSAVRGAVGMVAFGVGTLPMLTAIGVAGHAHEMRLRRAMPVLLVVNACVILVAALRVY